MKRSLYIIGGITLAISMPSHLLAQTTQPKDTTMNRTVVVEQEYNPDIMDASKVNVLPAKKKWNMLLHSFRQLPFRQG